MVMMQPTTATPQVPWCMPHGFDDDQFEQWRQLLEARTGMRFSEARRSLLLTQLGRRMNDAGYDDFDAYFHAVTAGGLAAESEWQELLDYLTVQETRFFRDPQAMELVADHLRAQWSRSDHALNLWSVGCATGEEVYSLAIMMAELQRKLDHTRRYTITGSDISAPAIHKAREGRFSLRKLDGIPEPLRQRYFDLSEKSARVSPALGQALCFTRLNVLDVPSAPLPAMDLIYCQNLLIYFRRWRRRDILLSLVDRLRPGGLLVLGPGELTGFQHPDLVHIPNRHCLAFLRKHETGQRQPNRGQRE